VCVKNLPFNHYRLSVWGDMANNLSFFFSGFFFTDLQVLGSLIGTLGFGLNDDIVALTLYNRKKTWESLRSYIFFTCQRT
jgi:hypothetical protein